MIINNGTAVKFRREFKAPVQEIFKAWSNPDFFKSWWKDTTVAEMDFKVGGSYLIRWVSPPEDYAKGIYKEIIPNEKIVMTWDTSDMCAGKKVSLVSNSFLTLTFKAINDSTSVFELVHDFLPEDRIDDHSMGWTYALLDMDTYFNQPYMQILRDLKVDISRMVSTSVEKVWEAWTTPAMLQRWFNSKGATLGTAQANLKVNGSFFLDYQFKDGNVHRIHGKYLEIDPMQRLVFTWIDDNTIDTKIDKAYESRVTVSLTPKPNEKTEVRIVHDQLRADSSMTEFYGGWSSCLESLEEELLADPTGSSSKMSTLSLSIKKEYAVSTKILFDALSRGALFSATGALPDTLEFDFRVGGQYRVDWDKSQYAHGEFIEIVPNEKIVFTWTGISTVGTFKDNVVTITLKSVAGERSELTLQHTGFDSDVVRKDHETGWNESLQNLKTK
ncbi:MAG: SRPBCC domain-containing protein [Bdellovibrionaceae bacterium]|nr:SRPBCC domain-containing protein [Pseudobdellovibrionaceae bacterium]